MVFCIVGAFVFWMEKIRVRKIWIIGWFVNNDKNIILFREKVKIDYIGIGRFFKIFRVENNFLVFFIWDILRN